MNIRTADDKLLSGPFQGEEKLSHISSANILEKEVSEDAITRAIQHTDDIICLKSSTVSEICSRQRRVLTS